MQEPSALRRDAEQIEIVSGHEVSPGKRVVAPATAKVDWIDPVGSEPGYHICATVARVAIVGERLNRKLGLVSFCVYGKQLVGVVDWKAAEHNGVNGGEDGRVRADAESEGYDCSQRESEA